MSGPRKSDPISTARRLSRPELPARFYKEATIAANAAGFVVQLDGKTARTPAKNPLAVPTEALAALLAVEWAGQGERIDPATMPMTRIVNAAIDRVANEMPAVRADIVAFAGSDLVSYRAEEPDELIAREAAAWSPLIAWARSALGARFDTVAGVIHRAQHPGTLGAVDRALVGSGPFELAAIHTMTTLTGSAVIALAVAHGRLTAEAAWEAAHVDEDWQMSRWGQDAMAIRRRAARWREMEAAALILKALAESGDGSP